MSRPRRQGGTREPTRRSRTRADATAGRGGRGSRARLWALGASLIVLVIAVLAIRISARHAAGAARSEPSLTPLVMQDSARAAIDAADWPRLAHWVARLLVFEPRDPVYLRDLAIATHNVAWAGTPYGRQRSATRTSLERIVAEKRAFALLDSSMTWSASPQDWALSRDRAGVFYETLGLPLDALANYDAVRGREPGYQPVVARVGALTSLLRDPLREPGNGPAPEVRIR